MKRGIRVIILVCAMVAPGRESAAHPVAFVGATQVQTTYVGPMITEEIYHTYGLGVAVGMNAEWLRLKSEDRLLVAMQHNWLIKRWNLDGAQANFYAGAGAGVGHTGWGDTSGRTSGYGRVALQGDYETLWFYTALKSSLDTGGDFTHWENTFSIGFAPYAHDCDKLATWIITDFSYVTEMDEHVRVIPKVRLFRGSWFVEAGCSLDGDPMVSAMIHF